MKLSATKGYSHIAAWLQTNGRRPFAFQKESWQAIAEGKSGLVNAPTGCGKTYSVFLGAIISFINAHPDNWQQKKNNGLQLLWVTPLRALAKDIGRAMEEAIAGLGMNWRVGIRNGDTENAERARQKRLMPEILITTPESLHLLIGQKNHAGSFQQLKIVAIDEWHELLGGKRGVMTELALSRLRAINLENRESHHPPLLIWGISATIGNLDEAMDVLVSGHNTACTIIRAGMKKLIRVESIIPEAIEQFSWAGHLGIKLVNQVLPIIRQSRTTLLFTNTRGQSELWYQALLNADPDLAGVIALHHGSIDMSLRNWIEDALHAGQLKIVVCTSSLDLGVDFRPVETVIQVGSPKGVARFLQRAGRSGHSPDAISKIYFLPTHSLELAEAAALKTAITEERIESREPALLCFDVLVQWLCTLAVGDGFIADDVLREIKTTWCFREIDDDEWRQVLGFIVNGGPALRQYDDYKKVEVENGRYLIKSRKIAMRHRMHIGTIVSDAMMKVRMISGSYIGMVEEWFVARMNPGDSFTLAGKILEFVMIKEMTALVRRSKAKKAKSPSWTGGRMPLSSRLSAVLRETFDHAMDKKAGPELKALQPLFRLQAELSHIPQSGEMLIEHIETDDGYHLFVYPFEGRLVHEAMAALVAWRLGRQMPISFSIAMNDYGFELLSDQPIPVDDSNVRDLFTEENLMQDIQQSINATEMARRKFRDIAVIGGLVFQGYPGEQKKARHLMASSSLLFSVFTEYEPGNLLLRQAFNEVMDQQMEEARMRTALRRIRQNRIVIRFPRRLTPFCFPIKVDSKRDEVSSEKLEDRVKKMLAG